MRLFDLHCDTVYECFQKNTDLTDPRLAVNTAAVHQANFSAYTQTFALWIDDRTADPYGLYRKLLATAKKVLPTAGFGTHTKKALLAVEGGALLEDCPRRVEQLAADGVRVISLTWNWENALAGGVLCDAGLTNLGREAIKRINQYGLVLDVSHLNERSFYPAVELAQRVVATHSNAWEICPHPRNLTRHQLQFLVQKGALVGLCPYPPFLGGDIFERVYANLCYMAHLGVKVAVGSDFDGGEMDACLNGPHKFAALRRYLVQKGLKSSILDGFFYQNAETFFCDFTNLKI